MSAYTDVTGHQVDQHFLLREIQQATSNTNQTTANTAIEEV